MALEVASRNRIRNTVVLDSVKSMSCSSVHFISTIKGGAVVKILNVSYLGKPSFRIKEISALYDPEGAGDNIIVPLPMGRRAGKLGDGILESDDVNAIDYGDVGDRNGCGNESCNDLGFDNMTLKELKSRCKTKKRKAPESVYSTETKGKDDLRKGDLSREWNATQLKVKQEECDLEEPLSCWKMRLSKKLKVERKLKMKRRSLSSPVSLPSVVVPTDHESDSFLKAVSVESNPSMHALPMQGPNVCSEPSAELNKVKSETVEMEFWDSQNVACVADFDLATSSADPNVCSGSSAVLPERANGGKLDREESVAFTTKMEDFTVLPAQLSKKAKSQLVRENRVFIGESRHCCDNESSIQHLEHDESNFIQESAEEICRISEECSLEMINCEPPTSSMFGLDIESVLGLSLSSSSNEAIPVASDRGSTIYADHVNNSSQPETLCDMHNNSFMQMPDMAIDDSLQCAELDGGWSCSSESKGLENLEEMPTENNEDSPVHENHSTNDSRDLCSPFNHSHPCFTVANSFHPFDESSSMTEEMLSPSATEESVPSTVDESVDHDAYAFNALTEAHIIERSCPPEKLLSTRKAISPTSQEKLCQAAEAEELCDSMQLSKHRKRLCFDKWTRNKTSVESLVEAEFKTIRNGVVRNWKNIINGSPPSPTKGILKSSHVSAAMSCTFKECSLLREHAEKSIAFSQRQMHDIECLAVKLMKNLKLMKNIVEDALLSPECSSTPSKYTTDEMRIAAEETVKLEETTRKWLSMMAKDCNRFCKIMKLKADKADGEVRSVHKERRKVVFADDVGGTLCHVKFFEDESVNCNAYESEWVQKDAGMDM